MVQIAEHLQNAVLHGDAVVERACAVNSDHAAYKNSECDKDGVVCIHADFHHKQRRRDNSHHHADKVGDGAFGFTNGNLHKINSSGIYCFNVCIKRKSVCESQYVVTKAAYTIV